METYKSPLHQTVSTTSTEFWNDSCCVKELTCAIENGATGATSNPTIVLTVLKNNLADWKDRIRQIITENPTWSEIEIAWKVYEEVGLRGARILLPVFERRKGLRGRLSIQTNPQWYRDADRLVTQALHFHNLAPNIQVKLPVTKAGIRAIEEATYHGVNINATVSFTVPQSIAVAEAVERGLNRREKEGKPVADMTPVCTIMIGRLDDWMQVLANKEKIVVNPGFLHWAGVAVIKKAYQIFRERGYRARLLAAAYRHHMHWSELIGGHGGDRVLMFRRDCPRQRAQGVALRIREIGLLALAENRQQINRHQSAAVKGNGPVASGLAFAAAGPSQLAATAGAGNDIPRLRILGEMADEGKDIVLAHPRLGGGAAECMGFANRVHRRYIRNLRS